MLLPDKLKHLLFIDIETVSAQSHYSQLDERLRQCWETKMNKLHPEVEDKEQLYFDRAAIYAEFGKVITIALGFFFIQNNQLSFKVKSISSHDEKQLLSDFKTLLEEKFQVNKLTLCAHNGKEFDYPYLCRRMIINGIVLPQVLDTSGLKPWEVKHLDTMELWKFGDKKSYTSLELLATVLDVPTSKDGIDGSKVNQVYYKENNLTRIAHYCEQDVVVTAQIYLRLLQLPLLDPSNIHFS